MEPKKCPYCDCVFTPKTHNQIYCSSKCRKASEQLSHKRIFNINSPNLYYCAWCGKGFTANRTRKYCSKVCMRYFNGAQRPKRDNANTTELARINQLARDNGLSYGRYVGKEYAKSIAHNKGEEK